MKYITALMITTIFILAAYGTRPRNDINWDMVRNTNVPIQPTAYEHMNK